MKNNNKNIKIEKIDGGFMDVWGERVKKIQREFPEVLSENQVDCNQLKKLVGDENVAECERYQFSWAGKSAAFQEIKKRTTATLKPDRKESVNFDKTENIFIEGENLEVLKILQKTYYGKIKMIYIDPPYNTGNDFVYNDQFAESREEYEEKTGDVDEEGKKLRAFHKNTKESGHYHSKWLSMMYPRLYLARNFLREDGVIFISIDDNEAHNLRMIMNEIFGEENFVDSFVIRSNPRGNQAKKHTASEHEYVLLYSKNRELVSHLGFKKEETEYNKKDDYGIYREIGLRKRGAGAKREDAPNQYFPIYFNPDTNEISLKYKKNFIEIFPKLSDGSDGRWRWSKKSVELKKNFLIVRKVRRNGGTEYDVFEKDYFSNEKISKIKSIFYEKEVNYENATEEMKILFNNLKVFNYPKPVYLIKKLIECIHTNPNDIILDFFAGSATTAHAVMDLNAEDGGNRKYIMVQLPEEIKEDSEARKAGYKNIAQIGRERIRRAAKKIQKEAKHKFDAGFKAFTLFPSNFKTWRREKIENEVKLQKKLEDAVNNLKEGAKKENMLFELMLKLGIDPNVKIEDKKDYYSISGGEYIICLSQNINKNIVENILSENPRVVVCLDKGFNGNDELKINTALQMKSKNIEFKVI